MKDISAKRHVAATSTSLTAGIIRQYKIVVKGAGKKGANISSPA